MRPLPSKINIGFIIFAIALLHTALSYGACYGIYKDGKLIYQSEDSPVNLEHRIKESVVSAFGDNSSMVIHTDGRDCYEIGKAAPLDLNPPRSAADLMWRSYAGELSRVTGIETDSDVTPRITENHSSYGGDYQSYHSSGYGSRYGVGNNSHIYTGPRGGRYTTTSGGHKSYLGGSSGSGRSRKK
jgi:hypothetical protein